MSETITHRIATRIILTYAVAIEIGRLKSLYARLSNEHKSALAKYDVPCFNDANKFSRGGSYANYASEAVPYCMRTDAAPASSVTAATPGH